jgi:uncharacterized protein with FMN-binding domain
MTSRQNASLAKRLLPALAMTTAASGLVALLDQPSRGAAGDIAGAAGAAGSSATAPAGNVTPVVNPPVVSSTVPVAQAPTPSPTPTPASPTPTPTPSPTPATPAPAASGSGCQGQTVDGTTIDTRWGPVQVEAVVSAAGQICDVDAIQSPDSHGKSVRINQQALPILHTEVMKAQSANINGVSGATITSIGYARSLQSILDKVG